MRLLGEEEGVFIGIASCLSGTVDQARVAARESDVAVRVVDSLTLSTGVVLLAMLAADLRAAGKDADEIASCVAAALPKVRMSFVLEVFIHLYLGGRCSALQSLPSNVLAIRPVITCLPDRTLGIEGKVHGNRRRALRALICDFHAQVNEVDLRRVFVTHSGCPEDAEDLARQLASIAPIDEPLVTEAGAVVASHCGSGTIGVLYLTR